MKYRSDFVTNSSSSSFIITKDNEINDVEKLFQYLKVLYCKWINAKEQMVEYCKNNKDFNVTVDKDGNTTIKSIYGYKTEEARNKSHKLCDILNEKFGMDYWDSLDYYTDWLSCETYTDYIEHTKDEPYISFYKKPFEIFDFSNITEENKSDINSVISWYFPCYDYETSESSCRWCGKNGTELCDKLKKKEVQMPTEFGNVCVFSECGYIPDFVRNELEKICSLHCNHMG